jgi:phenylpropionate dioxygenase-like ring-hydroxylating dioxygenase large terminal subunit
MITRDLTGAVHATINACRHRGAELVPEGYGELKRLTCPYHAWSYDLAGCLVGVYGEKTFGPVDRAARSLIPLPVEERLGFVWVSLTPGADLDLDTWLAGTEPFLRTFDLESGYHYSTRELDGPNWKIVVDGYLEGYHFASLHRDTVFKTNMSNMTAFDSWGPHQRTAHALKTIAQAADQPRDERNPADSAGVTYFTPPSRSSCPAPRGTRRGPSSSSCSGRSRGTTRRSRPRSTRVTGSTTSSSTRTTPPATASSAACKRSPAPTSSSGATSPGFSTSTAS